MKEDFTDLSDYRVTEGRYATTNDHGGCGAFVVPTLNGRGLMFIVGYDGSCDNCAGTGETIVTAELLKINADHRAFKGKKTGDAIKCPVCHGTKLDPKSGGFEHVSVHVKNVRRKGGRKTVVKRFPTWEEMCFVKDLFWDKDEAVAQFHWPEGDADGEPSHTLHLWKHWTGFALPPKEYLGKEEPVEDADV